MKRLVWIICGCIILTGCSKVMVTQKTECYTETKMNETEITSESKYVEDYYTENTDIIKQIVELQKSLHQAYSDGYYEKDPSGYDLNIEWEIMDQLKQPLNESSYGEKLEEIYPGIGEFIKGVEKESVNKAPQSIVINNAAIKMIPMHLYDRNKEAGRNQSYVTITNYPIQLQDAYFKTLAEVAPKEQFIIHTPYITGDSKLLRIATPAFGRRSFMGEYQDDTYKEVKVAYEPDALGYQLYIRQDALQKVRVIYQELSDQPIDRVYFEPLMTWCKDQWQMDTDQLAQVEEMIQCAIAGERTTQNGMLGEYQYSYKTYDNPDSTYLGSHMSEQKETIIELVIEKK